MESGFRIWSGNGPLLLGTDLIWGLMIPLILLFCTDGFWLSVCRSNLGFLFCYWLFFHVQIWSCCFQSLMVPFWVNPNSFDFISWLGFEGVRHGHISFGRFADLGSPMLYGFPVVSITEFLGSQIGRILLLFVGCSPVGIVAVHVVGLVVGTQMSLWVCFWPTLGPTSFKFWNADFGFNWAPSCFRLSYFFIAHVVFCGLMVFFGRTRGLNCFSR